MNRKHVFRFVAVLVLLASTTFAQQPAEVTTKQSPEDRVVLYQALLDLTNPWTVMCIAAHPDDEDGTSLIVMRRKYGAHTVSLFSTFGEGGQNAIGPELYEELGAIRARETMAAAEVQGSEAYFLGLRDFGYSKSADEAFKFWGHEEALRRMVLQIRKLRPDVIITNHSVTNNDHGHHQATARLTLEAFDAAADPKRFPEQLKDGVTVWQVQRLFVRAGRSNQAQAGTSPTVSIDPNERDPIRETVYAEEALRGLQKHATQGPWPKTFAEFAARFRSFTGQSAAPGQLPPIRYVLTREAKGAAPITKDSHNFLDGLRLPDEDARKLAFPMLSGSPPELAANRPEALAQLIAAFKRGSYSRPIDRSGDPQRRSLIKTRIEQALALAAGIDFEVRPTRSFVIPDSTLDLWVKISNSGSTSANVNCNSWVDSLMPNRRGSEGKVRIPANAPINIPLSEHLYESHWLGLTLNTRCAIEVSGVKFSIDRKTHVDVAPGVEIATVEPSPLMLTPGTLNEPRRFTVLIINNGSQKALVGLDADSSQYPGLGPFSGVFELEPGASHLEKAKLAYGTTEAYKDGHQYDLLPKSDVLNIDLKSYIRDFGSQGKLQQRKVLPVIYVDARVVPNLRVGYIRGFDYSLPNALTALGVESKELSVDEVKSSDLQKYSSIIVDNRVYESTPGLIEANQKLLDYAKNGGTLIVFYHKSFEWNPDERRKRPQLAPYKLILGDERITDENAPITFLEPQHPLLNFPNKISQEDFAGWIQERGLYYPKEWDLQFHALLQSNDPGEAPLKGGLLVADYGRGRYIYTSMVWYRELRAGVPGAYRILANMISYGARK